MKGRTKERSADQRNLKALRVLVVEDSRVHQQVSARMLQKTGLVASIRLVGNLHAAFDALRASEMDLICLDLGLPDSQGLATFDSIHNHFPNIPIIVLSASTEESTALQTIQGGGQDYLVKGSFDVELLKHVVQYCCERHRAEAALRASEATTRAIFESSLDAMVILDDEGRIVDCNPAASLLSGISREQLISRTIHELAADKMEFLDWGAIRAKGVCEGRFVLVNAAKEVRHVDFVTHGNFLPQHHCVVFHDVTEKLEKEARLRQAHKMETIGQLASGVAHDFNNLLMVITGYAELFCALEHPSPTWRRYMEQIMSAAGRGSALTQQLLTFSRKQTVHAEIVNVQQMAIRTLEIIKRLLGTDICVSTRFADDVLNIRIDRVQLEQLLINLCLNARDAMPKGGELTIEGQLVDLDMVEAQRLNLEAGPYVCLQVRDTGIGMSEAVKSKIFEPFFTTKDNGKGTGLGLATVYGIVQQAQGSIQVDSAEGKGTTLQAYFPQSLEATSPESHDSNPASLGGKETILLVEDEEPVRKLTADFLASKGYCVIEASNGLSGLQQAHLNGDAVRCVVTDVVMPGMRGTQMAEHIRAAYPGMCFVFMSGNKDRFQNPDYAESVSEALLQKPFSLELLGSTIRSMLDGAAGTDHISG